MMWLCTYIIYHIELLCWKFSGFKDGLTLLCKLQMSNGPGNILPWMDKIIGPVLLHICTYCYYLVFLAWTHNSRHTSTHMHMDLFGDTIQSHWLIDASTWKQLQNSPTLLSLMYRVHFPALSRLVSQLHVGAVIDNDLFIHSLKP